MQEIVHHRLEAAGSVERNDVCVLGRRTILRIQYQHHHIRALNCFQRAQARKLFYPRFNFATASNPGSINQGNG